MRARLEQDVDRAFRDLEQLRALGIDLEAVGAELESEGIAAFVESHDRLLKELDQKHVAVTVNYAQS